MTDENSLLFSAMYVQKLLHEIYDFDIYRVRSKSGYQVNSYHCSLYCIVVLINCISGKMQN